MPLLGCAAGGPVGVSEEQVAITGVLATARAARLKYRRWTYMALGNGGASSYPGRTRAISELALVPNARIAVRIWKTSAGSNRESFSTVRYRALDPDRP